MSYKIPQRGGWGWGPQPRSLVERILDSLIRGIGLPHHDATKSLPFLVTCLLIEGRLARRRGELATHVE